MLFIGIEIGCLQGRIRDGVQYPKLDVLDNLDVIKICVAYEFEGPVDLFILVDPTLQLDLDEGAENKKMVPVKFGARYYFF